MSPRRHPLGLTLRALLGCCALWPVCRPAIGHALSWQPPVRTVQFPATPEPPLPEDPALPEAPQPRVAPMPPEMVLPGLPPVVGPALPPLVLPAQPPVFVSPDPPEPPAPVVAIRVRVAAVSAAKAEIEYRICVHNTSPAAAHHVLVRNPLPANARFVRATPAPSARTPELQWHLGTLAPGACCDLVLVLAPTDDNDVKNCARVQFEHGQCVTTRIARSLPLPGAVFPEPKGPPTQPPGTEKLPPEKQPSEKQPSEKQPPPPEKEPGAKAAKLELKMTGPKRQYANLAVKYQLTVRNSGAAAATNVLIANPLPAGMTLVNSSAGSRLHAGQVAWTLGTLAAGASKTVQIILKAKAAGEVCNKATALADDGLKAEAEVCTRFEGVSALTLELMDAKNPLPVGEETSYTVTIQNQGTAPVTNLRLTAVVPPEMQLLQAKGASEAPPAEKLPKATAEGQPLPFAPLKALAPGAMVQYRVFVRALRAGDVRFKVELTADQLQAGGPVREEQATRVFTPEGGKGP